jgi:ABC-2 type transport system ATP-binding protein
VRFRPLAVGWMFVDALPAPIAEAAPDRTGDAVILADRLTKVFPTGVTAVDDLHLEVGSGEIFGLLGPNGAGKTTTVGMLTTRVVPTSGTAVVAGVDVVAHPALAKARVGVVSQSNTLDRSLTVRENLYYHGRYFGMRAREARRVADTLLEVFRLTDRADADVATLSGGMAQRLMVARAVAHRPQVLFLDEPTSGLDPQSRLALWEILGQIHREGQTVVLTTHFMEEADKLCQRVAIMDHGRVLALDAPTNLKRTVGGDIVVRIRAGDQPDRLAAHLRDMDGITGATVLNELVQLTARGLDGLLPRVIQTAEAGGFTVRDVSVDEPTLETVFINLTGKDLRE